MRSFARAAAGLGLGLALALAAATAAPPRPPAAAVWAGLRGHAWRRRLAGVVPTPHRVQRLGAWVGGGRAGVGFHPGADCDWARPEALYSEVPEALSPPPGVVLLRGRDSAGRDPSSGQLSASIRLEARACAPGPPAGGGPAVGVLQGLNLTSSCDPARQPEGTACASDGAWLTRLSLEVSCGVEAAQGVCGEAPGEAPDGRSCLVQFEAGRGECPDSVVHPLHRPKPFDRALDWRLEVHLGSLAAPSGGELAVVPQPRVRADARPLLARNLEPVRVTFSGRGGAAGGGGPAVVALRGFGFALRPPEAGPGASLPAGRYLEELAFACEPAGGGDSWQTAVGGALEAECLLGVRADPRSLVWPATVDAWLDSTVLELPVPAPPARVRRAGGAVCASGDPGLGDLLFSCRRRGIPERSDAVVALD